MKVLTMAWKIIILMLMAAFYSCYFIKMFHQKKQGIQTNHLGKGKTGFIRFIEIALQITSYILPIMQILSVIFCKPTESIILKICGVVLTALGVAFFVVSVLQMKDSWRAGISKEEKTNLVTGGIYSISRNPAFVGFELMYIGILYTFFSWYLFLATAFAVMIFHLQIVNVEEPFLAEVFGNEYIMYKNKVCRYIGRRK